MAQLGTFKPFHYAALSDRRCRRCVELRKKKHLRGSCLRRAQFRQEKTNTAMIFLPGHHDLAQDF
jgi:hypothetical protein